MEPTIDSACVCEMSWVQVLIVLYPCGEKMKTTLVNFYKFTCVVFFIYIFKEKREIMCIFCDIANKKLETNIVYEDEVFEHSEKVAEQMRKILYT